MHEALRRLEVEGLVTIVPHSGARVATLDFEWLEIYLIRERIEPLAAGESVGRLSAPSSRTSTASAARSRSTGRRRRDRRRSGASTCLLRRCAASAPPDDRRLLACDAAVPPHPAADALDEDYDAYHHEHRLLVNRERERVGGQALVRVHIERSRTLLSDHRELFDR